MDLEDAEFRELFRKLIESCLLPQEQAEALLQRILTTLKEQGIIRRKEGEPPWNEP